MTIPCGTTPCSRVDEIDAVFRAQLHALRASNQAHIGLTLDDLGKTLPFHHAQIRALTENLLRYLSRAEAFDLVDKANYGGNGDAATRPR